MPQNRLFPWNISEVFSDCSHFYLFNLFPLLIVLSQQIVHCPASPAGWKKQNKRLTANKANKQSKAVENWLRIILKKTNKKKQCKQLATTQFQVHSSPIVSRSRSRSRVCGPSQVDYLLCLGKCQTRVNRQLFSSLRKNSIGTLMRQSKLLVSGTVPTSVIFQTIRLYGRSFSSLWKNIIFI